MPTDENDARTENNVGNDNGASQSQLPNDLSVLQALIYLTTRICKECRDYKRCDSCSILCELHQLIYGLSLYVDGMDIDEAFVYTRNAFRRKVEDANDKYSTAFGLCENIDGEMVVMQEDHTEFDE